ncbi:MAG: AAA family ATPase [Pseudomonadota bacterium]
MYTSYFGLTEKPFTITPDPRYLFMSTRHGEALAHLIYGVTESDGFIQLTGEVGTGKTTLVRSLLQQLPDNADIALVLNPQLSAREFLATIGNELGVSGASEEQSLKTLIDNLNEHLLASHARGRRTILVVDEAQNLAAEVLEQVRMLTNLETTRQKLLQIILIGQPELRDLLARNDLRQLAQRVTARYHLEPLSRDEVSRYIDHRLKIAGAMGEVFTPRAKREVYRLSNGIPRIVNVVCDRSLLGAYVREQQSVDHKLVRQAGKEIAGARQSSAPDRYWLPVLGTVGAIMLAVGAWSAYSARPSASQADIPSDTSALTRTQPSPTKDVLAVSQNESPSYTPEPESGKLADALAQYRDRTGTASAFSTLFSVWGADRKPGTNACEQAENDFGLNCLFLRGSWNIVRQLNRPAILTLTDESGESHQVVLTKIDGETAEIRIGDATIELPMDEISDYWFGESLLIWKPPNGVAKSYRQGLRDPNIKWLRNSLAVIQGIPVDQPDSDLFDETLELQVKNYQRSRRLKVDGLVGQQTQIIINTDLGLDGIPVLVQSGSL